jgi:hypothetical protein
MKDKGRYAEVPASDYPPSNSLRNHALVENKDIAQH